MKGFNHRGHEGCTGGTLAGNAGRLATQHARLQNLCEFCVLSGSFPSITASLAREFCQDRRSEWGGLPRWSACSATSDNVLEFTMNDGPLERQHFEGIKMAFWDGAYETGFKPTR